MQLRIYLTPAFIQEKQKAVLTVKPAMNVCGSCSVLGQGPGGGQMPAPHPLSPSRL